MPITFLDEEEEIVPVAPKKTGKRRINPLDEEEPPEEEGVKPESEVITTTSGRKITFLDEEEEPIAPVVEPETPSASEPPTRITFLDEEPEPPTQPKPPVGTSFIEELVAIPQAIKQSIDQPLKAMGETAQVLGASGVGGALRGAIEGPEDYVPAAQRFMEPQEGEFQVAGFAPQFLPRAIVEQAGQIGGAILTRAGGMAIGGLAGSALGPKGTAAGAVAGAFIGPALFEMGQIVGPVARERAANQGREEPNTDDLAWAWATAGASGALNAIGAKYIPGGDKLTGSLAKKISTAIAGESSTEGAQSVVQQTGQTFLTEQGFEIKPKEVIGETILGGGASGTAVAATAPFTKAAAAAETKVVAEQVAPIAPETAQAVSEQANRVMQEAQAEEATETPDQRVARLQREAQEGVDIELEEEPPVSGLPPQPVTPTPEAPVTPAVAPVEPVVPIEGVVEPTTVIVPAEPTVERPAEPPVDRSVTILNYDEKAQPIQDQIDNRIDELVGDGMSFEDANNDPSVTTLLDRRLSMDRGAINSYREIVNTAFTEQGVTQNDLTINPAQAIIENVYAAPRAGDEGLIASVAERGQEAFDDDAATVKKLSEAIFKYRAEAEGMTPEELLGPNSGLTEEGKQARVDEARIAAETIHNQIKNSLLEQAQVQPPEALALPPVTPTPVTPTPVTPEVPTAVEPPALSPLRRVVKAEQTEEDVSGLVGQGLVELYKGQPVITQAGLETLPEAERPRLTPEARKIQIDTRTSEAAAEAISKNLRIGVDQVPPDVRMPAGWTIEGDIYIPPVVEAAPEARESRRAIVTPQQDRDYLDAVERGDLDAASRVIDDLVRASGAVPVQGTRVYRGSVAVTGEAGRARLEALGFGVEGMIRIVEDPQAAFEGRTIIQDGKAVRIELNASALRDNAAIDRVLNHEFAEAANADGALNRLVERLTPKEKKEINDAITRLGYEEGVRTTEEAARAIETLAAGWKGRGFFERAVARVEAWGSKLGLKLTRRAAEYIAARNLSDINAGFKAAYEQSINRVAGEEARYSYAGMLAVTPRFMRDSLKAAQSMAAAGKTNEEIRLATGWFKGKYDNKLRWEIPDYKSFIKKDATNKLRDGGDVRLEDVLEHPELYAAYPDAKRIKVYLMKKDEGASYAANTIGVNPFSKFEGFNFRNAMLHEIQHWIQDKEGLASGTSPERFVHPMSRLKEDLKEAEDGLSEIRREWYDSDEEYQKEREGWAWEVDLYKKIIRAKERGLGTYQIYQLAAGEIEANDVERRNSMDEESRKRYEPYAFSKVSPKDAIAMDVRGAMPTSVEIRESRREPAPTFTEESPEAKTLSNLKASMEKVDAASEAKGGKPTTQKVSEIAANWMEQGGDERALQDAITENTNLSPVNAAKVAKVIAKQYRIQESIAETTLETEAGVTLEGLPEGMEIPKDVDPKNKRTVLQRVIDATTGVRVKPVILQVPEKTALKEQIRLKARETREAKKAQQETADAVVEAIKALELRGPMRAKQAQALAKRAAKVIWTSEKSMENFIAYAERVMANTNYDADLREAKAAQKRAKELSKRDSIAAPQRETLEAIGNIGINLLNDPREFADVVNHYLRSFKPVVSEAYVVVPDKEMKSYLSAAEDVVNEAKAEFEIEDNERLADKYGITIDELKKYMDAEEIVDALARYAKREVIEGILNEKSAGVKEALKGVDTTILRVDQRKLIDAMRVIDVKSLDAAEKQAYVRIGNNIIFNNNQTNGAEFFVATAQGQQAARDLAKNTEAMTKNKAWSNIIPALGSRRAKKVLKAWAEDLQSVADTFRNAFGKEGMTVFYEAMGMVDLDLGFTKAARTLEEIQIKMEKFYKSLDKKYKGAATNQDGILSEGIVGYLIQNVPEKGEADSLVQRRGLLQQDVEERRKSGDEDRMQMADRIQQLMQKLDGETVDQILANLKREYPANYESLTWLKDELFPQYKDFLKQFDENFNDQANNYNTPNYLPIVYSNISPSIDLLQGKKKYYDSPSSAPKQSSYTIKRSDYAQLPLGDDGRKPKEIGLNLRKNAYNSLSDQITRANTNPARQRIYSFLKTPESEEALGGAANRDFFAERIERLMESRERRGSFNKNTFEKAVDVLANLGRDIGTRIALAGSYQLIRQPADQVTVAIGVTGRADLMAKHLDPRQIKAARPVIDLFSIGRRGDASSGYKYINQMEGAQSRLERYYTEGNWVKAKEASKNFADKFMAPLKVSDFTVAAATWMTFYRAHLAKNGTSFTTWEDAANLIQSNDVNHRRAAAYAENMTDIYQGSSDPTKMAVFAQKGKTGPENLLKAILVPFNSFGVQFRSRISSELTEIFTRSGDWRGKAVAVKDLGATIGGTIMFGLAKRFVLPAITYGGVQILYSIFGVDVEEPDEEKKKEEFELKWRQLQGDVVSTMIVGGGGQMLESYTIDGMNYLKYMIDSANGSEDVLDDDGEVMSFGKYAKERAPFYRYRSFDNAMSLGILDIGMDQAKKSILNTKMVLTPEEMDKYTPEEQRFLYVALLSDWLYLGGFNDADFARMWDKARRDMINAAKEREKYIKSIRSGR